MDLYYESGDKGLTSASACKLASFMKLCEETRNYCFIITGKAYPLSLAILPEEDFLRHMQHLPLFPHT